MKIYIAGPEVFRENALEVGSEYKKICEKYGFTGLFPLDNESRSADEIYRGNLAFIDSCHIVAANANPFRGEMDSGTAFEVGYAAAKGKIIALYMEDTRPLREKYGFDRDSDGMAVEDFGLPLNLMPASSAYIVKGGFEDCIKLLKKITQ